MDEIEDFLAIAHRVVWCSLATVDRRNRPRSRLVHPIWPDGPDSAAFAALELTPWRIRTWRPPAAPRVTRFPA